MLRIIAILFGVAFIFCGVAGFLPSFTQNGLLFGYFEVSSLHNVMYLVSGVIAIMAATSYKYAKLYFQLIGIIYAVIAIAGFYFQGNLDFMLMHMNTADHILHIVLAVVALYLGFVTKKI